MPKRMRQEEFIRRARLKHGDKYGYSEVEYTNSISKVRIRCPKHGIILQSPANHLRHGCQPCGLEKSQAVLALDTDRFIAKARLVHPDSGYDYAMVEYSGGMHKVRIACPQHGPFWQRANNHLSGIGCPRCGRDKARAVLLRGSEDFISKASSVHASKYGYGNVRYDGAFKPVEIACPRHGGFWQTPDAHVNSKAGCPSCSHRHSAPQKEVGLYLESLGVKYKPNEHSQIPPYELDILIPSASLGIEFNGRYWHSLDGTEPPLAKFRHRDKFLACEEKGITLLQIDEHEWDDPVTRRVWKSVISSKLGKNSRIYARDTQFSPLPREQAEEFFRENHLQGSTPAARWNFGLLADGRVVGAIAFSWHQRVLLSLTRLCFAIGTTVVGGAQKLFANSLPALPGKDIVTFSNNRYSSGKIYPILGFRRDRDLPPSYQWYFHGRVWDKRMFRRSRLPRALGEGFRQGETEQQNMYRNGARCLYDAGYRRWVFCNALTAQPIKPF